MTTLKNIKIIFALAVIIAGVFVACWTSFAYAEQASAPWNVDVIVSHNGDDFCYDLSKQINGLEYEADKRGFYLGYNGKRALADSLTDMFIESRCAYEYLLPDFDKLLNHFSYVEQQKVNAEVNFSASGFAYSKPQNGVSIDVDKLFDLMISSRGKRVKITLPLIVDKAITVEEIKQNTVKKSSFTTTFYASSPNRCFNIELATRALNGVTVKAGEEFSFNKTVGKRTEQNGYKNAKVILDGNYTDGVGGGVCQVSTTLYNALLLAGFIPKASQHSLVSSYVMAGFDAMVSDGGADLSFVNNTSHDIYIQGKTHDKSVTFTVFGEPNEYKILRENVEERQPFGVVEIVDKIKYPQLVYVDDTQVITNGSDGVKTKSYLKYYKNGELVATRLIRSNNYKRVDKVIARGSLPRPEQSGEESTEY